jgi:hypothetical protein
MAILVFAPPHLAIPPPVEHANQEVSPLVVYELLFCGLDLEGGRVVEAVQALDRGAEVRDMTFACDGESGGDAEICVVMLVVEATPAELTVDLLEYERGKYVSPAVARAVVPVLLRKPAPAAIFGEVHRVVAVRPNGARR